MEKRECFSGYHPIINFIYFALVLVFSMCLMHPVMLGISLACALGYGAYLRGMGALKIAGFAAVFMMLPAVLINTLFNHNGETDIAHFPGGNPLTLESLLYGLAAAVMLAAIVLWFACWNSVITSDKILYIFGRVIPSLSLIISMTLGFVPDFVRRFREVKEAQMGLGLLSEGDAGQDTGPDSEQNLGQDSGRDLERNSGRRRRMLVKNGIKILSIMITWSLERGLDTADSMKSRGFGLSGRTSFSIYGFRRRDGIALAWLAGAGGLIIWGWVTDKLKFVYYPTFAWTDVDMVVAALFVVYACLCGTPLFLDIREDRIWQRLRSEI